MAGTPTPEPRGTDAIAASVIVSTRNRAHILESCLDSLLTQRCALPYEIITVDNASDDATPALLEERARLDPRIVMVQEPVPGRSRAMNAGIRRSRGRVLLFTDDDVLADPAWISSYVEFFDAHPGQIVVAGGPILPTPYDGGAWPAWVGTEGWRDLPGGLDWGEERPLHPPLYLWGANIALPRSMLESAGLWDETLGHRGDERGTYEDIEYQDRVRSVRGVVWFLPQCVVHHRVARGEVTPRSVLRRARIRGANDYWRSGNGEPVPRQSAARSAFALAQFAGGGIVCTALFRLDPQPRWFQRARASAHGIGWAAEELTHRRRPQWSRERLTSRPGLDPWTSMLRRAATMAGRLTERLAPDLPA